MIGLDTNVLARDGIDDARDAEAKNQRQVARRLIDSGRPPMVAKSMILEFEWVLRGYYRYAHADVASVIGHHLDQAHIAVEDRGTVARAPANRDADLDFADVLHHASYHRCATVATFDDRKFARRAKKLGLAPPVIVAS